MQQLRARGIGHVLVSSTNDRPWSQYYCCVIGANNEFLRKHPVATKAVIRSLLRAADICATDPARGARGIVERRASEDYGATLATLRDIPYGKWTPEKIIAKGTDWRFLNEVKRELKI